MRMRLRQVALVAKDLAPVERDIEGLLGVDMCFRDPGVGAFGLHNALFPGGDKLLEVVSPREDGTTAGRLLDKRKGDGGYMVILQVDDLAGMRARFDEYDVRTVFTAEAPGITGIHLHPRDVGGAILSVDQAEAWDSWPWAGPSWRQHIRTGVVTDLVGVAIQARDPQAMAQRWAEVLGRAVTTSDDEHWIELDEGTLRFVPLADDRGEGVSAIDVRAGDGELRAAEVCGTTVNFVS